MAVIDWTIHPAQELARHRNAWDAINAAAWNTPVLDTRYLLPLLRHMGAGGEALAVARSGGEPCAMALVARGKAGTWYSFEAGGCPFGAWVDLPGSDTQALAARLLAALPGFATVFAVMRQDPDLRPRPGHGPRIRTLDYISTARIRVSGGFAEFWNARSKSFRQNIRTARNRLQREQRPMTFEIVTDPSQIGDAVDAYGLLESAGWKASTGNALHPQNAQGQFFREMMADLARIGNARVYRLLYGDRLVASSLCVHRDRTIIVLRTSYDASETFTSPGQLMHYEIFQRIFDGREFDAIEFYGSVMEWETRWTSEVRSMYHLNVYRAPLVAGIHDFMRKARRRAPSDAPPAQAAAAGKPAGA